MAIDWIEFLVEEPSMGEALQALVPKIRPGIQFDVHAFEGKSDLLAKLPNRFKGYSSWLSPSARLVVVLDRDASDGRTLKKQVEGIARKAGLVPKPPKASNKPFHVLTRLAIEELEAWFFGDVQALAQTYPGVPATLGSRAKYRDPDAIGGGTWEALLRELQKAGHFKGGLPKRQVAREVSANMVPGRNTSRSFQAFRNGVAAL